MVLTKQRLPKYEWILPSSLWYPKIVGEERGIPDIYEHRIAGTLHFVTRVGKSFWNGAVVSDWHVGDT